MALLWDICNSSWCYSESIFKIYLFDEITLIHSSTFYHIGLFQLCQRLVVLQYVSDTNLIFSHMVSFIYECQIILDVMMRSATLTQVITYCRQCGQSPGHLKSWFENFAMCGAQDSVHIAGNVVCYYFKIRPAVTLIFSLNVSIFHSGWCEEVGVDT